MRFKEKLSNSEIEENEDELYWKRYYNFRDVRNKQPKKSILKKSKFIMDKTQAKDTIVSAKSKPFSV